MNKELLSIGEMAKLNGVGIKALRYYEKIGLLLPAYVNKETGYRYYTLNQSAEIDIILTCIELGIPLKQVLDFKVSEGSLDMKHLLQFGKEKAEEKLQRLQMRQHQLDSYIKGMNERDKLATRISSSKFLIKEISANNFDIKEYIKGTTCLYQKATQIGIASLYLEGIIYLSGENKVFCAVEVDCVENKKLKESEIFIYPENKYRRLINKKNSLEDCFRDVISSGKNYKSEKGLIGAFVVWQDWHKRDISVVDVIQVAREKKPYSL